MAKIKAYVYENGGELLMHPPVVVLGQGDTLNLVNTTDEDVNWIVPAAAFGAKVTEVVQKKKESGQKSAGTGPTATGYKVIGLDTGRKARGNSDPVIIIDL